MEAFICFRALNNINKSDWILDSGASKHISNDFNLFLNKRNTNVKFISFYYINKLSNNVHNIFWVTILLSISYHKIYIIRFDYIPTTGRVVPDPTAAIKQLTSP